MVMVAAQFVVSFAPSSSTLRDDEKDSPSCVRINTVVTVSDVDERNTFCDSYIKGVRGGRVGETLDASCCAAEGRSSLPIIRRVTFVNNSGQNGTSSRATWLAYAAMTAPSETTAASRSMFSDSDTSIMRSTPSEVTSRTASAGLGPFMR